MDEKPSKFPVSNYLTPLAGKTMRKKGNWWDALVLVKKPNAKKDKLLCLYKWRKENGKWKRQQKYQFIQENDIDDVVASLMEFCGHSSIENLVDVDNHLSRTVDKLRSKLKEKEQEQKKMVEKRAKELEAQRKSNLDDLKERLNDYKDMLDDPEIDEENYQQFLGDNVWFFGTEYFQAERETPAGFNGRVDFLLTKNDGYRDVVEVKKPTHDLFLDDGSMSAKLKDTLSQIAKYLDYYNKHYLDHKEQTDKDVYKPKGIVVIGSNSEEKVKERIKRHKHVINSNIEIWTYDDLKDKAQRTINTYEQTE